MKGCSWYTLVLALAVGADARAQAPPDAALEVRTVRFFRPAGRQTVIDVFCRVPFALLDAVARGPGGMAAYRFAVTVRDSAGLTLVEQSWRQTVPAHMLGAARGSTVEHFSFAAQPGRYSVEVAVTDSASGRVTRRTHAVDGYGAAPGASDLLLATSLRAPAGPADTAPRAGEIRKGGLYVAASDRPVLTPQQASLGYYAEIYLAAAETVTVGVRVMRPDGSEVIAAAGQRLAFGTEGGVTRGLLPLAGLPAGDYRLELAVTRSAGRETRTAPFGMAGFETEAALAAAAPPAVAPDVFDGMADAQLDTLYAPLVYIMTEAEQGLYATLSADGKRTYLRQFWGRRDPTPGTPRNEAQEDYYRRIAAANQRFRERGTADIPGWRTDRGRIFVRYGPPDEVLARPQASGTSPYEVWKYTRGRALKYVFLDQTRFGNYALIWTDDRREPSRANWQDLLGPEAVLDVERF